jgi:starch synthase
VTLNILLAASEAVPFVKSGGLADVAGSLAKAIRSRSQACRVVLPLYSDIPQQLRAGMKEIARFRVELAWRNQYCGVLQATYNGVKYYFLDNEYYFKRSGLYGFYDDGERFAFFSRAVLEMLHHIDFEPEIIHCNDWQTALVPVFLDVFYRQSEKHRSIKTVFTIHNIQYQGIFGLEIIQDVLGLPEHAHGMVEYQGNCNYMKAAIEQCNLLTTVSPTYAQELTDPWFAHGLHTLLAQKRDKMRGILNGIDQKAYNPSTDPHLIQNYTACDLSGKAACKQALQQEMGLEQNPAPLLIGMVTRLADHKGLDLVQCAFSRLMERQVQFVLLGSGDGQLEQFFREAASRYPGRVGIHIGFDEALARRIYSGVDLFLMPSRSEPCGLAQMIAMGYGTIPVVRSTGGLRDSVRDFGGENGNGYTFLSYHADDMLDAICRACQDFANPQLWTEHCKVAMACDFGWGRSALEYISLYRSLLSM